MLNMKGNIKSLIYRILPSKAYLQVLYKHYHGKKLNLSNPKRFSEKLFWLKLYNKKYNQELIHICYDKYDVRQYVIDKIGEKYLPKLYGVYNNVDEIDFESLPEKYVIKITQSCGQNIINNGKTLKMTEDDIRKQLKQWLEQTNNRKQIRKIYNEEEYYFTGKAKIICEEYLEDKNGNGAMDSDFWCFNGKVKMYDQWYDFFNEKTGEKNDSHTIKRNFYDVKGNFIPVQMGRPYKPELKVSQLSNRNEMIEIAETLSQDFPFLRVDLYNVDGRIVVGELTMIPMGAAGKITPDYYDELWGDYLRLPNVKL